MRTFFTLVALAAMTMTVHAQDLVIPTNALNPDLELTKCRLDPIGMNVGNTSTESVICIGEVDFSEDYQAVGMAFSNGYGGKGNYAILKAGADPSSAQPFAQLALARTGDSYQNYVKLAGNMGYSVESPADLPGGQLAKEGLSFSKPEGKQKVYVSFVGGAGNVQAIHFYKNTFSPSDFHSEGGWEPLNGQLLSPTDNMSNYAKVAMRLAYENSQLVSSPSEETRKDGNSGWGWTTEGVVVDYGTMDFGDGEFTQVCGFVSHWNGDKINDYLEVYIDDVNDEANKIAFIFTGNEYHGTFQNQLYPRAAALNQVVTGSHKVLVKWHGGSTNLTNLDFCKGTQWCESPAPDYEILKLEVVNETPSQRAKYYTMRNNVPEGAIKIQNHAGLNKYQLEGNGNYGYTGPGTVIKFGGIDFENGQFNRVILGYSTGGTDRIDYYKKYANISLYLDLEAGDKSYNWGNAHEELADVEPVAVIRHQATGGWGNVYNIGDDLAKVKGVHDVYLVYYQAHSDQGANIFDFFLDRVKTPEVSGIKINHEDLNLVDGQTHYNITITDNITSNDVEVSTIDTEDCTVKKVIKPTDIQDKYLVEISIEKDGNVLTLYTVNVTVVAKVNETPSANAKHYTMRPGNPSGATTISGHEVLYDKNKTHVETAGNYGFTDNNTVIKLENIDFEDGRYDRIILGYSTGGNNWKGNKEDANISLYLDLEKGGQTYDWANVREQLASVEPIAVVRYQATGGWGNVLNIGDDLATVTGSHTMYVVYNINDHINDGANIFDYYLDSHYSTYNGLAALEETEVASNKPVVINADLEVVHKQGNIVWAKDNAQSYNFTTKEEGAIDYLGLFKDYKNGDQNNWIRLVFANESAAGSISSGDKLSMVKGEYTGAPGEKHVLAVSGYESTSERGNYEVNVYFPANFMGGTGNYVASGQTYFFVAPKIEEYCRLTMAVWNGEFFTVPAQAEGMNSAGIKGAVRADFSMCGEEKKAQLETTAAYSFMGFVTKAPSASNGPARILTQSGVTPTDYVFTIIEDVTSSDDRIVTGVDEVNVSGMASKAVKMIENGQVVIIKNGKKYNMMGQTIK